MSGWNEMGRRVGSHLTPQNRKSQRRHSDRYRSDTYTVAPLLSVRRADRIASAALSSYFTLFFRFRCGSQLTHTKSPSHRKLSLVESIYLSIYLLLSLLLFVFLVVNQFGVNDALFTCQLSSSFDYFSLR